jgi:hypothetical protein
LASIDRSRRRARGTRFGQAQQVDMQPPPGCRSADAFCSPRCGLLGIEPYLLRGVHADAPRDARHADLASVTLVALPQHLDRFRSKGWQKPPQRLGRTVSGHAEQQRDLHIRGLPGHSLFQRRGVFMSIDEEKPGGVAEATQRRNSAEQDSAVAAVEDREAVLLKRCAHARVNRVHHFHQRAFVHWGAADCPSERPEPSKQTPIRSNDSRAKGISYAGCSHDPE